jgi:hypothetical protein
VALRDLGEATGAGRTASAGEGVGAAGWSGDALPSRLRPGPSRLRPRKRALTWLLTGGRLDPSRLRVNGCGKRGGTDGRNEGAEFAGG